MQILKKSASEAGTKNLNQGAGNKSWDMRNYILPNFSITPQQGLGCYVTVNYGMKTEV